jgi:hypothetical protein
MAATPVHVNAVTRLMVADTRMNRIPVGRIGLPPAVVVVDTFRRASVAVVPIADQALDVLPLNRSTEEHFALPADDAFRRTVRPLSVLAFVGVEPNSPVCRVDPNNADLPFL